MIKKPTEIIIYDFQYSIAVREYTRSKTYNQINFFLSKIRNLKELFDSFNNRPPGTDPRGGDEILERNRLKISSAKTEFLEFGFGNGPPTQK